MSKILLVEDDEMLCDMLSRHLKRRNYSVIIATNGDESLSMAESEQPDVILMDMNMPVMDGLEATRLIKKNPATAQIPVVVLSGHVMHAHMEKAKSLEGGADDYDTKPVNIERLVGKIQSVLQK